MDVRSQRGRDTSPDRAKRCRLQQKVRPATRKVQVVYYLSRNGLLEHPHYVEVTLSANEPLRLKDVCDRLISLRGSGMPLQYSWSCKRNYKSGYVWYDLAMNDIIHPAEGSEYVLKGSELVEGCSGRFQQLQLSSKQAIHQQAEPNYDYNLKRKPFNSSPHTQREAEEYEEYEEQEEEYEDGEKTSYTSSTTTPHSRCSRGVSTDELLDEDQNARPRGLDTRNNATNKVIITNHLPNPPPPPPPPSTTTLADKLSQEVPTNGRNNYPVRFEDGTGSAPSRNSVLLQLIACGSSVVDFKAKNEPRRVSNVGTKSESSVDREEKLSSEAEMINYLSENPRFGNLRSEEKEYFSGSLVESMKANRVGSEAEPVLKKSNSYNEERSSKVGLEDMKKVMEEEKRERKGGVKGKCIPRKKSSKESRK